MDENKTILNFIKTGELPVYLPSYPIRTIENMGSREYTALVVAWNRMRGLLQNVGIIKWECGKMVYTDKIKDFEVGALIQY